MSVRRVPWNFIAVIVVVLCLIVLLTMPAKRKMFTAPPLELEAHNYPGSIPPETKTQITRWDQQLAYQATLPPISGFRNSEKKFLSIGISTVYRSENYLQKTLESFVNESTFEERDDVVVIVYLADTEQDAKELQLKLIQDNFQYYLDSGFIQVISATPAIYPPMDFVLTERTFNDSADRVIWRTKQVIDFAYLFSYAKNLSEYYLVAEDDIISGEQYISIIRDFVGRKQAKRWVALEFSEFMCIGLLFHNKDLPTLIELLVMFHRYQPVDLLMRQFISIQVQDKNVSTRRIPSIFQHFGKNSTLPNKVQKIVDTTFGTANRRFKHRNPPAELYTTMGVYYGLTPDLAYKSAPGYFWGIPQKSGDTFDIIFPTPLNISRVVILTGVNVHKPRKTVLTDPIVSGVLEMTTSSCLKDKNSAKSPVCSNFQEMETFGNGTGILDLRRNLVNVHCLRVRLGPAQKSWVVIREIEVFQN